MELREKTIELKDKLTEGIEKWMTGRIDDFTAEYPTLKPIAKYLKRGVVNMAAKEDARMTDFVEGMMLFIADKDGNYDMGMLFDDALSMLQTMPETPFDMGLLHGTMGGGVIRIMLPDNPIASLFMGNMGAIKITEDDFKELKTILTT